MASGNNDISDIVKKCRVLLLDIEGTTTSISFVKDKLFPYAEENVKEFLTNQWDSEDVKEAVTALRKLALEDKENSVDGVIAIPGEDASKEDQIEGLVKSVKWQMSSDRKAGPLKQLQGLIWKQGYDKGDIKGHVYDDVSPAMDLWRSVEGQKIYIYSSGSVQAQKLLFGQSQAGDMLKYIDGHFDTAVGAKQETSSYTAIAEKIGCKPEEILFLTDIVKEAEAARACGMHCALVSREGNAALPEEAVAAFPVLYSLATLANPNKRKPDAQDEQPAKVLKTDVDADVKTSSEIEVATEAKESTEAAAPAEVKPAAEPDVPTEEKAPESDTPAKSEPEPVPVNGNSDATVAETEPPKVADEPEKMEVDEPAAGTQDKACQATEKVVTTVEEITDVKEIEATPACDIEPIIEESSEKTENTETDKMETESSESVPEPKENDVERLKNGHKDAPIAEETPPASVITEIKDVTNDKEELNEVTEMIEDIEPVVEEPPTTQDMEDLQNVGEVLEKECDEILSKVQDVTNLDNIPIKPLLNTIAEETMETENTDSNDIVERILDSEMEMETKKTAEKTTNTTEELAESKVVPEAAVAADKEAEDKQETKTEDKQETKTEDKGTTTEMSQDKPIAEVAEVKASEENVDSSSSTKTTETEEATMVVEENETKSVVVDKVENKTEEDSSTPKTDTEESKTAVAEVEPKTVVAETKVDTDEKKVDEDKPEPEKVETPTEQTKVETETPAEPKECEKVTEEAKPDSEPKEQPEAQVNGKATNGDAEVAKQNGDASKEAELSARLSLENGKEVNGANGDSVKEDEEEPKTEKIAEVEVADIKVKNVAVDETRNDPIEQPTEA